MRTAPRRALGALAVLVLALLTTVFTGGTAYAHATVESTTPQANATVDTQPKEVTVAFSEPVSPVKAQTWIVAPDGSRANSGDATVRGNTLVYPLREGLPNGTYLVGYRVISADGHPVPGGFTFSIGQASASPPTAPTSGPDVDPVVNVVVMVLRGLSIAGLALAIGPTLLLLTRWSVDRRAARTKDGDGSGAGDTEGTEDAEGGADRAAAVRPDPDRPLPRTKAVLRLTAIGLSLIALTSVLGIYAQAPYSTGAKLFAITGADVAGVVDSRFGTGMLLRLFAVVAALPLLLVSVRRGARNGDKWLLAVLGLALVASWPIAGHATTSPVPPLTVLTDTVHVGAGAIWLGGLVTLVAYLLRPALAEEAGAFMPVWSAWAMRLVVALGVAGAAQALIEIGEIPALWETTYGRLVIAKAVLLAMMLGAAAFARDVLRKRAGAGLSEGGIGLLRRSIAVELVVALAVIGVTSVLVQTTPARVAYEQQQAEQAEPVSQRLSSKYFQLQVEVAPGKVGSNTLHLYAFAPDGTELDVLEWKATVSLPSSNLPPITVDLLKLSPNHTTGEVSLPTAGDWQFSFTLRTSRTDQATVTQNVPVK